MSPLRLAPSYGHCSPTSATSGTSGGTLPLTDVHPNAALSAEAAEAADRQGALWPMHDLLLEHQQELQAVDLVGYAADLRPDVDRFREDLRRHVGADRVATITLS